MSLNLALIIAGGIVLNFLTGAVIARLKLKEYVNLTPTEDLPFFKKIYRRLLFPFSSNPEYWLGHEVEKKFKGYVGRYGSEGFEILAWSDRGYGNGKESPERFSILRSPAVSKLEKNNTTRKYVVAATWTGLFHLFPILEGIIISLYYVVKAISTFIFTGQKSDQIQENDKLSGFRNFRDKQVAAQKERLEELKRTTEVGISAMEKLISDWQSKIEEINVLGLNPERYKALVEKISVVLKERKDDLKKINKAILDIDDKKNELNIFIGTLELYQRTAELIPGMNGEGKSITAQIEENTAGADAAIEYIKKFYDLELEMGARLQLAPDILAQSVAEGLEKQDLTIHEKNKISQ